MEGTLKRGQTGGDEKEVYLMGKKEREESRRDLGLGLSRLDAGSRHGNAIPRHYKGKGFQEFNKFPLRVVPNQHFNRQGKEGGTTYLTRGVGLKEKRKSEGMSAKNG